MEHGRRNLVPSNYRTCVRPLKRVLGDELGMRIDLEEDIENSGEEMIDEVKSSYRKLDILHQVLSSTTIRIYSVDRDGTILFANRAGTVGSGLNKESMVGKNWKNIPIPESIKDPIADFVIEVFRTGKESTTDMSFFWLNGIVDLELSFCPVYENGSVDAVVITAVDVTQRNAAQRLSDSLNDINIKMSSSRDIDELLKRTAHEARKALGAECCSMLIREKSEWTLRASSGIPASLNGLAMRDSIARSIFGSDFDLSLKITEDASLGRQKAVTFDQNPGAVLSIPMKSKKECLGVMAFDFDSSKSFESYEIDFITKLSTSLSLHIENAQLQLSKETEKTLLETILENAPVGIALLSSDNFQVKWVNQAGLDMIGSGFSSSEVHGRYLGDLVPGLGKLGLINLVLDSGETFTEPEYEYQHPSRGQTFINFTMLPLELGEGHDFLVIASDVTEQVKTRRRLEELAIRSEAESQKLKTILNAMPVACVILDIEGTIVNMNDMFRKNASDLGVSRLERYDELKAFKPRSSDTGLPIKKENWAFTKAIKRGETVLGQMMDIEAPNGRMMCIWLSATPIKNSENEITGCIVAVQNLTEQRMVEQQAVHDKEKAELYLSVMGHDIDNIIAVASGYIQILEERAKFGNVEKNLITKTKASLDSVHELVQTMRSIRKSDSEALKWGFIDLDAVIQETVEGFSNNPCRDVQIRYERKKKSMIVATELVGEIFDNIVGNAIKHSSGAIKIDISNKTIFEGGREFHLISIEDTGPGIPDDLKPKIFSRLQKGKKSGDTLGLFLVKKLTEDFGGRVWVEDRISGEYKEGAKFVVMLPIAQVKTT